MLTRPQRYDLASQTAKILRDEISRGGWTSRLPGERLLAAQLKVSRPTLRLALQQLARDRCLRCVPRHGYEIVRRRAPAAPVRLRTVHLLCPDPLENLRHLSQIWIAELRQLLLRDDCELLMHHGRIYLGSGAAYALRRLVAQQAPGCWLLAHSTRHLQTWFIEHGLPTVIAGYPHEGVRLPGVQIDVEAVCRHAAGVLLRAGHQHIVFLREETDRAGDRASDRGFRTGSASAGPDARIVTYRSGTPDAVIRTVNRLLREARPPTALLVGNAQDYATVSTHLLQCGIRIPQDISLICREDDNYLAFLRPRPACYVSPPGWFATRLHAQIRQMLAGLPVATASLRVVPEFLPGHSQGPAPAAS